MLKTLWKPFPIPRDLTQQDSERHKRGHAGQETPPSWTSDTGRGGASARTRAVQRTCGGIMAEVPVSERARAGPITSGRRAALRASPGDAVSPRSPAERAPQQPRPRAGVAACAPFATSPACPPAAAAALLERTRARAEARRTQPRGAPTRGHATPIPVPVALPGGSWRFERITPKTKAGRNAFLP